MRADQVRVWRAAEASAVLLMAGQTTHYAIEPRGEYVFGIVAGNRCVPGVAGSAAS